MSFTLTWSSGLPIVMTTRLYWQERLSSQTLLPQAVWLESSKTKSCNSVFEGEIVLLTAQECNGSRMFLSDSQHSQ